MASFVDPRDIATRSTTQLPARTTTDPQALTALHQLCRDGRLYDVERWIQEDRPLQVAEGTRIKGRRLTSALEIGLEERNHALVLVLLCNGYDPNLEARSPLNLALQLRRWDFVDLLLEFGADPQRVDLSDLFETYRTELWERFHALDVGRSGSDQRNRLK